MNWRQTHKHNNRSDEDCITAYRERGDLEVLGMLFERYVVLIFGVCLKYLKDPADSEDATMEIFELLTQKLKTHRIDAFRSWLYIVTKNHCLQILRRQQRIVLTEVYEGENMHSEEFMHPEEELLNLDKANGLKECLEQLPTAQKQSIELFYYQSKSYQEIAELMILDKEQVRSHIQNGRRNLRICIDRKSNTPDA